MTEDRPPYNVGGLPAPHPDCVSLLHRGATIAIEPKSEGVWQWLITFVAMLPLTPGYEAGRPDLMQGHSTTKALAVQHAKAAIDKVSDA